jgi:hypothetical protein
MVTSENPALHMAKEQPNEKSYRKPPFPCMAAVSTLKARVRTITSLPEFKVIIKDKTHRTQTPQRTPRA